jgi:hypothetical protein
MQTSVDPLMNEMDTSLAMSLLGGAEEESTEETEVEAVEEEVVEAAETDSSEEVEESTEEEVEEGITEEWSDDDDPWG